MYIILNKSSHEFTKTIKLLKNFDKYDEPLRIFWNFYWLLRIKKNKRFNQIKKRLINVNIKQKGNCEFL